MEDDVKSRKATTTGVLLGGGGKTTNGDILGNGRTAGSAADLARTVKALVAAYEFVGSGGNGTIVLGVRKKTFKIF